MTFGDIEPADAFDPTGTPDPEQVARRLHELRRAIDIGDLPAFDDLPADHRLVAYALAAALIDWLRRQGSIR